MTGPQLAKLEEFLRGAEPAWLHHGDCIGADAEAHAVCLDRVIDVALHPPTDERLRAFCQGARKVYDPQPFLKRDRDIVMSSDMLVAAPKTPHEVLRSGTWTTLRYAKSRKMPWVLLLPDGQAEWSSESWLPNTRGAA